MMEVIELTYTDDDIRRMDNVSTDIAAKYLGKNPQFIRCGLQHGIMPFGIAVKNRRWSYNIPGPALVRYKLFGRGECDE